VCFSLKSLFDSLDGIDQTADKIQGLQADTDHLASLTP
jgi:RND superfamily putative drug exporter